MIIWLASYPKSGNTWIRSFLVSLLFTKDGKSNLDSLNMIGQYPLRSQFKNLIKDFTNVSEIKKNWIKSQEIINLDKKVRFFKTHHAMVSIDNYNFTNDENTLGVIYIVRDPRNIVSSVKNHYSLDSIEQARDLMFHDEAWTGFEKNPENISDKKFPTLLSSWNFNFNSWKQIKKNYLLIKYENLLKNPFDEFGKIINYLKVVTKTRFSESKISEAINSNNFKNLQIQESQGKFKENMFNKKNEKIKFFDKGPENDWRQNLDPTIAKQIEKKFSKEMSELGYLD
jgi:hypothetical protein|tara:strand:- start:156 stop:1007 length:852 start_codon:yes stop_codon:yes gene_type:complete